MVKEQFTLNVPVVTKDPLVQVDPKTISVGKHVFQLVVHDEQGNASKIAQQTVIVVGPRTGGVLGVVTDGSGNADRPTSSTSPTGTTRGTGDVAGNLGPTLTDVARTCTRSQGRQFNHKSADRKIGSRSDAHHASGRRIAEARKAL